ncbi:aminodeoxychorismate lyase [Neobacillus ginsengisoli]|uniref:Cell division protein YceG involved in septum cleavage n=1 Tax=Neobacillus ginsengisoli TaxID=904295 RepID=A0ABT9XXT0_9BACI|nr:aminodeoxychorismate lyase [Neobacillus ginsengisoli]MDQ0200203.1 cell division protein YceG involved in septum cleavage [Neobacillus ginsengisoli]
MRINLLSSFAAGLLISTTICGAVYFSTKSDVPKAAVKTSESQTTVKVQPSENEMKNTLVSKGYIVQTIAEFDKKMKDAKGADQKQAAPADNQSNKAVTKVILNVSDGMTSIDVGNMLVRANLVPNAFNFSKDIEKKGLENKLRPGVFVVDSNMSYDQVVSTIFK